MGYKDIDAELSAADIAEIREALEKIQDKLSFLIHLSMQERRRSYKMGDKGMQFISDSLTVANANRGILPNNFDIDQFSQDYELSQALMEVHIWLSQLTEKVDDTLMAVGGEAMKTSLRVYDYVKSAAKHEPGLKVIAEQLGDRFKKTRRRRATAAKSPEVASSAEAV